MRIANVLPLFTLVLGACAVGIDDDAEDGYEAILIASVDRPSGSHVEFLTTEEGGVLVTELFQVGNQPTLPPEMARTVDPRDYYLALTGEAAPDDLAAAVEASDLPYRRVAPSELMLQDGPIPTNLWGGVDDWHFERAVCNVYPDGSNSDSWCHLNQTPSNNGGAKHKRSDVNGMSASACADTGEVVLRIAIRKFNDWARHSYRLDAGLCAQYSMDRFTDFDAESWVLEVGTGDRYHHAGMWCWSWGGSCPVINPPLPE
ncbi:MAG TPA: hypothetical protein VM261_13035 [Kofleriaceae bacterium]|nr:hypothetical protein [Kofleriaceae bacterium]